MLRLDLCQHVLHALQLPELILPLVVDAEAVSVANATSDLKAIFESEENLLVNQHDGLMPPVQFAVAGLIAQIPILLQLLILREDGLNLAQIDNNLIKGRGAISYCLFRQVIVANYKNWLHISLFVDSAEAKIAAQPELARDIIKAGIKFCKAARQKFGNGLPFAGFPIIGPQGHVVDNFAILWMRLGVQQSDDALVFGVAYQMMDGVRMVYTLQRPFDGTVYGRGYEFRLSCPHIVMDKFS